MTKHEAEYKQRLVEDLLKTNPNAVDDIIKFVIN